MSVYTRKHLPSPTDSVASIRTKRFRFSNAADIVLLKAVACANAYVSPWGRNGALFDEAYANFLQTASSALVCGKETPSQKSIEDRFKMIIARFRLDVKRNVASSGIMELYGELETLLDDLLLKIDEHGERERAGKDERLNMEKKLVEAGEEVRNMPLNMRDQSAGKTSDGVSPTAVPKASKTTRRIVDESDDQATNALQKYLEPRRKQEDRRFKLEEERYKIDTERVVEDGKRFYAGQELKRRKLELDEKKADVEIEERKIALLERRKMLEVLSGLAKKLN